MLFSRELVAFLALASMGAVMAAPVPEAAAEASPQADCEFHHRKGRRLTADHFFSW
jgi:hypothetical protein